MTESFMDRKKSEFSWIRVAEFWLSLIPLVIVLWTGMVYFIHSEIKAGNTEQDKNIYTQYVPRPEFEERMKLVDERMRSLNDTLRDIREEQKTQRSMLEKALAHR